MTFPAWFLIGALVILAGAWAFGILIVWSLEDIREEQRRIAEAQAFMARVMGEEEADASEAEQQPKEKTG